MKVIDLINKASKGEEMPKKIRIEHWGYTFEWIEHTNNYYDENADIDLMSALSMDEELNYEVYVLEGKKIEKLKEKLRIDDLEICSINEQRIWENIIIEQNKINEIIDYINKLERKNDK